MKRILLLALIIILSACDNSKSNSTIKINIPYKVFHQKLECKGCGNHFVYINIEGLDKKSTFSEVQNISRNICQTDETFCQVFYWIDEATMGKRLPMTDEQANSSAFQYNSNQNKHECKLFDPNNFKCPIKVSH
jgi:hypothetical protein